MSGEISEIEEEKTEGVQEKGKEEEGEVEEFLLLLDNGEFVGTEKMITYVAKELSDGTVERSGTHTYAIDGGGASPSDFINRVPPHYIDRIPLKLEEAWEEPGLPNVWRWGPIGRKLLY